MHFFLYLPNRLIYRAIEFFRHWYLNGFRIYSHFVISRLEALDRTMAFRITLKNIFEPLYRDRTFIGYLLGFIFRSLRLFIGGILYAILIGAAVFFYLIWLAIPVYIIYRILKPLLLTFVSG